MKLEVWKDIEGYPNYQVSNFGNVKSKERYTKSSDLIEFTEPINISIDSFNQNVWHKEIQYVDNKYICI